MTEDLFDETSIRASFVAVATRLEELDAPAGLLIVVGGSFMALHGLRDSTHDIDTVNRISASIRAAAEEVALARGFEPDWLNDRAAGFTPVGLDEDGCELFYEHPRLRVLGPPLPTRMREAIPISRRTSPRSKTKPRSPAEPWPARN